MSNVTFAHANDHAVVALNGDLDWDAAFVLVDSIDTMVETYFYTTIELVVSSPGGNTQALHYCLARLDQLANEQVRLRTRVLSFAGSAAAVLVSSGDERLVEPGALLAWHGAQLRGEHQADARTTAALASALTATDDRLIERLVSRALATAKAKRPAHRAERSDRWVLELLTEALRGKGETKVPRKTGKLARAVGSALDGAVRDADRKALSNVYRRLFELDATVSAHLAATLRLVDRVGAAPAVETVRSGVEGLVVPKWRVLYAPDGTVPRDVLTRHTLVLGETGSCILPVVAAMAGAPRERLGAALIIDPKRELAQVLHRMAPERLHHVTVDDAVLKVMADPRWSLEGDLGQGRWRIVFELIVLAAPRPIESARCLPSFQASFGILFAALDWLPSGPTYPSRALLPRKSESLCVVTPPLGLSPHGRRARVPRANDPSNRPRTASFAVGCDHISLSTGPGLPAWGSALSPAPLRVARTPAARSTTGPIRLRASSSHAPFPHCSRRATRSLELRARPRGDRYSVRFRRETPSWLVELAAAAER